MATQRGFLPSPPVVWQWLEVTRASDPPVVVQSEGLVLVYSPDVNLQVNVDPPIAERTHARVLFFLELLKPCREK